MPLRHFAIVIAALLLTACTTSRGAGLVDKPIVPLSERYNTLAQAIRTLPNIQVEGEYVRFRGVSTFEGDDEVRFLVEGRVVGTYAQVEPQFPLTEVRRVRLIRPQQAATNYGALGSNGLIELVLMP